MSDDAPRPTSLDLAVISVTFALVFVGTGALQTYLAEAYRAHGVDAATAAARRSVVLVVLYGSFLVWRVFIGATIQVLGDYLSIVFGIGTYLLFALALRFSASYPLHLAAAVVMGWGAASIWVAGSAQVLYMTRHGRFGWATAIHRTSVLLGLIAGLLLMGRSIVWDPTRTMLLDIAWWGSALALVAALAIPRRRVPHTPFDLVQFGRVAAQPNVLVLGFFLLGSAMSYGIVLNFLNDYVGALGHGPENIGWVLLPFFVAQGVFTLVGGVAIDRLGMVWVLRLAFVVAGGALLAIALFGSPTGNPVLVIGLPAMMLGIQNGIVGVASGAMAGRAIPPARRHFAIGAMFMFRDLGVVVPSLVRLVTHVRPSRNDVPLVFCVFAGYFIFCALLTRALSRRVGPPEGAI